MNNVFIKGQIPDLNLDRKLNLHNGSLIIVKQRDTITGIYMVVSFRDNKNKYNGSNTTSYCSLVNLDNGSLAFEERCSRSTTVRRVLNHVLRLGFSMPYNPNSKENDNQMKVLDICDSFDNKPKVVLYKKNKGKKVLQSFQEVLMETLKGRN